MYFRFFNDQDFTEFFYQICQIANEIINKTGVLNDQWQIVLRILGNKMLSVLCFGKSCIYQNHGPISKKLFAHWMNLLTLQLKNCLYHKDNNAFIDPNTTLCKSNFNYPAFVKGFVNTLIICTVTCLFIYYKEKITRYKTFKAIRASDNIYTQKKGEMRENKY
ncbi:hypothetical protein K6025_05265 [Ehrlichia sp. JZT12]